MLINTEHCCSIAKLCLTFCDPMDSSMPGFPVLHYLPEFDQTHFHRVSDAIQPSHALSSPSPPAFDISQQQGLLQWVGASYQVAASVLPMNIQGWFPLGLTDLISLQSQGLWRVFSNTTVQKHQFFGAQPSNCQRAEQLCLKSLFLMKDVIDWGLQTCIHSPHKEQWTEEHHATYKCLFGLCLPWCLRQPTAAKLPRPTAPSKVQEQLLPDSVASLPIASFLFRSASVIILSQTHPHIYIQFPWINILLFLWFQVLWWAQENCFSSSGFIYHPPCPSPAAAAAAKSLQSCPTLCDPIDSSPPGSPVPGILQVRTLEWVAISFSNAWKGKVKVKSLSCVRLLATAWTAAYQAPPSMGFSRQEYWSGLPLLSLLPFTYQDSNHDHKPSSASDSLV